MNEKSKFWDINPTEIPDLYLEDEHARWVTLLEEPLGFSFNPLRYGPLTTEGYTKARKDWSLRSNQNWPKEPASIAALLVKCEIKPEEAANAANVSAAFVEIEAHAAIPAKLLAIHHEILVQLGITPTSEHLLDVMDHIWFEDEDFETYMQCFEIMKNYLANANEETVFLDKWLSSFSQSNCTGGTDESIGVALASVFRQADPKSLITWCKQNDDPAGLGYLVFQGKTSFYDFLKEVVEPYSSPRERGYNTTEDENISARYNEQLDTLFLLLKKLPVAMVSSQGSIFYEDNADKVDAFLSFSEHDIEIEDRAAFILALCAAGVIPLEHDSIKGLVQELSDLQADEIDAFLQKKAVENAITESAQRLHYEGGPIAARLSHELRDLIARDIVLRIDPNNAVNYINYMADPSWLNEANVASALISRQFAGHTHYGNIMLAFYPFLNESEKVEIGESLIRAAASNNVRLHDIGRGLHKLAPEAFDENLVSPHTGAGLMLHHLTQKDPAELFATLSSLDVSKNDPLYMDMAKQWFVAAINKNPSVLDLPPNVGEDVLGY